MPLVRSLLIVMVHELLGDFAHFLQGGRSIHLKALLTVTSMVSLDVTIFVWPPGWADIVLDSQAEQEAAKGRRKITTTGTSHPSGVSVEGPHGRQTILAQEAHNGIQGCFGMKIGMRLSTEQDGGPSIDKIEHFDHMLPFSLGVSRNSGCIFKVHLDFLQRLTRLQWLARRLGRIEDEAKLAQAFPDRACGSRRDEALSL